MCRNRSLEEFVTTEREDATADENEEDKPFCSNASATQSRKASKKPNTMKHGKPDLWTLDDGQYWPEEVHHRSSGEVHSREEFPDESDSSICFGR